MFVLLMSNDGNSSVLYKKVKVDENINNINPTALYSSSSSALSRPINMKRLPQGGEDCKNQSRIYIYFLYGFTLGIDICEKFPVFYLKQKIFNKMKSDNRKRKEKEQKERDLIKPMMQKIIYEGIKLQNNEMFDSKISTTKIFAHIDEDKEDKEEKENSFNDQIKCIIMNDCTTGFCHLIYKCFRPWLITDVIGIILSYMCNINLYDHESDEKLYYHGGLNAEMCIPRNSTIEFTLSVILLNDAIEHKTFSVTTEQSDLFEVYNWRDIELGLSVKIY